MIHRYKSLRPQTYDAFLFQQKAAKDRLVKRKAKRSLLGLAPRSSDVNARLDSLHSLAVRLRDKKVHGGTCLVCVAKHQLGIGRYAPRRIEVAYHIVPRGDYNTRWRMDNAVGACKRCNFGEKMSRERESGRATYRIIHAHLVGGEAKLLDLESLSRLKCDLSVAAKLVLCETLKKLAEGS